MKGGHIMPLVLAEAVPMTTIFQTALDTIKTDVFSYIQVALPVGLVIAGTFIAIKLGINFFKSIVG